MRKEIIWTIEYRSHGSQNWIPCIAHCSLGEGLRESYERIKRYDPGVDRRVKAYVRHEAVV